MIQTYSPRLDVPATRGFCLQYIDDAGGLPATAPPRTATAKIAYENEKNAGRISSQIDSPVGIWVVGFLSFTKGPYTELWHVFFMKHLGGGKYDIRDSEVASGSRKPYGSLGEIVAWFGAYKPSFLGWSTHCDGREYASKEEDMTKITRDQVLWHYRLIAGAEPTKQELDNYEGKEYVAATEEIKRYFANRGAGYQEYKKNAENKIKELQASLDKVMNQRPADSSEAEKKIQAFKDALNAL